MLNNIILAIIQAATEFLPISSSGHLALISNLVAHQNLFYFTVLHMASLIAVIIFTRKELICLLRLDKNYRQLWIHLVIATIPAILCGIFLKHVIEKAFSSFICLGIAFIFTGIVLFTTKFKRPKASLNIRNSVIIGIFQALALFPGVSRSGMTISAALLLGMDAEKAARFSFLLFIPLCLGAFVSELGRFYINLQVIIPFLVCFIFSLLFLNILLIIAKKGKFWMFSAYCILAGILSLVLQFR